MSLAHTDQTIEMRYDLDAPPARVWRAITVPALRARWLPDRDLAGAEAVAVLPEREVSYRLREDAPPFLESTVTFHLEPGGAGRTRLRVVHRLTDPGFGRAAGAAANGNAPLMRAA